MDQTSKNNDISSENNIVYDKPTASSDKIIYDNPMASQKHILYDRPKLNPEDINYDKPTSNQEPIPQENPSPSAKSLYDKPIQCPESIPCEQPILYPEDVPYDMPNSALYGKMVKMPDRFGWWWFTRDVRARAQGSALYLTIMMFIFGDFYCIKYFPSEFAAEYIFTVFASIVMVTLSLMVYYGIKSSKPHMLILWLFYTIPGSLGVLLYLLYLCSYVSSPFSPSILNYPDHAIPLFITILLLLSILLPFPYFWWAIYITYKSIKRELALVPIKGGNQLQPWFGNVFQSEDCSSCLMVEIGEQVRDYGQPCECCGRQSRTPLLS